MRAVDAVAEACLRLAARRWPADLRTEQHREWYAELHALRTDPDAGAALRAYRQLRFAASLACSRPAEGGGPALTWRDLAPGASAAILLLLAPLAGVILTQLTSFGLYQASTLMLVVRNVHDWALLAFGVGAMAGVSWAVALGGRWAGTRRPLTVARGVAGSVPPLLALAVGILLAVVEGLRIGESESPGRSVLLAAALAALLWTVLMTALCVRVARLADAGHRRRAAALAVSGGLVIVYLAASVAAVPDLLRGIARFPHPLAAGLGAFVGDTTASVALVTATAFAIPYVVSAAVRVPAPSRVHADAPAVWRVTPTAVAGLCFAAAGLLTLAWSTTDSLRAEAAGNWTAWLWTIQVLAALVGVLGLVVAVLGARAPAGAAARRFFAGLAFVSAVSTLALFSQGKWEIIIEVADPVLLPVATAILTGLLAALAATCALAARHGPVRAWAAAALIVGLGLAAGLPSLLSGGDSDARLGVAAADVLANALPVPMVLLLWWVVRGGRPRRPVLAAAGLVGLLLAAAVPLRDFLQHGLVEFAARLVWLPVSAEFEAGTRNLPGVLLIGVVLAVAVGARLARGDRETAPAGRREGARPVDGTLATGDSP